MLVLHIVTTAVASKHWTQILNRILITLNSTTVYKRALRVIEINFIDLNVLVRAQDVITVALSAVTVMSHSYSIVTHP